MGRDRSALEADEMHTINHPGFRLHYVVTDDVMRALGRSELAHLFQPGDGGFPADDWEVRFAPLLRGSTQRREDRARRLRDARRLNARSRDPAIWGQVIAEAQALMLTSDLAEAADEAEVTASACASAMLHLAQALGGDPRLPEPAFLYPDAHLKAATDSNARRSRLRLGGLEAARAARERPLWAVWHAQSAAYRQLLLAASGVSDPQALRERIGAGLAAYRVTGTMNRYYVGKQGAQLLLADVARDTVREMIQPLHRLHQDEAARALVRLIDPMREEIVAFIRAASLRRDGRATPVPISAVHTVGGFRIEISRDLSGPDADLVQLLADEAVLVGSGAFAQPWVEDPSPALVAALTARHGMRDRYSAGDTRAIIAHSGVRNHLPAGARLRSPRQAAALDLCRRHRDLGSLLVSGRLESGYNAAKHALRELVDADGYLLAPGIVQLVVGEPGVDRQPTHAQQCRAVDFVLARFPRAAAALLAEAEARGRQQTERRSDRYRPSAWFLDRLERAQITHYIYRPELAAALNDLERAGATRLGYYSLLGGTYCLIGPDGRRSAHGGGNNRTADEEIAGVRSHLERCAVHHAAHGAAIDRAIALLGPGSIVAVRG